MNWHAVITAAGLAIAGHASPALALHTFGVTDRLNASQPGVIRFAAAAPKRNARGGINTTTTDVDGDGTSVVVVQAPPKPKHKPVRRVRRHR
jgi:hypothetical protein